MVIFMKVMQVVGNRPQFIKLAPVSRELNKRGIPEIIIHTGQHYDNNMSEIFFEELEIPYPDCNLEVGSGSHAQITANAIIKLEEAMLRYMPTCVTIYGDTDSTLAAAVAACKLQIPIIHIESGGRTFSWQNPEECNRVMAERVSSYLCAADNSSLENLRKEGYEEDRIFFTGDVMYDEFRYCMEKDVSEGFQQGLPSEFVLMTWHRQENTCDKQRMQKIIDFIKKINFPVVLPLHPRTKKKLEEYSLEKQIASIPFLKVIEPVGYLEMVYLMKHCKIVVTDSGGLSKEASFVQKRCVYILNLKIYPELQEAGYIYIVDMENEEDIKTGLTMINESIRGEVSLDVVNVFGDGDAAIKIADIIEMIEEN